MNEDEHLEGGKIRTFSFFIEDNRYAVPTLEFVTVRDARRAEEVARQRLDASPHHLSVTVHADELLLFRVERSARATRYDADRRPAGRRDPTDDQEGAP